jgi:hypothetical protein
LPAVGWGDRGDRNHLKFSDCRPRTRCCHALPRALLVIPAGAKKSMSGVGLTEAEQIALAMAASMGDQAPQADGTGGETLGNMVGNLVCTLTSCEQPRLIEAINEGLLALNVPACVQLTGDEYAGLYNSMVIILFNETFGLSRPALVELMETLYVFQSSNERVHHVLALEIDHSGNLLSSVWRCSAGEQQLDEHPNLKMQLQVCIEAWVGGSLGIAPALS